MDYERQDNAIPLLDKANCKELLNVKSKLFISDCLSLQNRLTGTYHSSFNFEVNEIELGAHFASLNAQMEVIEEIIVSSLNHSASSIEALGSIEAVVSTLEAKVNDLSQSYRREYTIYAIQRNKETELTKQLDSLALGEIERSSTRTSETNCTTETSKSQLRRPFDVHLDIGNKTINDFMTQITHTIEKIKKAVGTSSKMMPLRHEEVNPNSGSCSKLKEEIAVVIVGMLCLMLFMYYVI